MALYKQTSSENWWISIYRGSDLPRKYIPTGTPDLEKAKAIEANIKAAMRGNMPREKLFAAIDSLMGWDTVDGIPVSMLWETYLKTKPTVGTHTLNQRKKLCEHFTAWMDEHHSATRHLHDITPQQACGYSDWLTETRGGKGKTHNNRISNLKTIFKAVVVRANMKSNPFAYLQKVPQNDSVSGRPFTAAEQKAIFKQCTIAGNDWLAICTLAKYSGLRLKDIAHLRWNQVVDKAIDVTPSKTKRHGIKVLVPLHPNVQKELRLLKRSGDYIFPVLAERYLENDRSESGFMDEVLNKVTINREDAHVTFHCWRHTFRTMMAAADVPQEIAMKLGGWKDQRTAEIYNHDFSQLEKAINSLG